jgi:hypothetical protein
MLTPFARPVISRILRLNRSTAFGAMTRLTSVQGARAVLQHRSKQSAGLSAWLGQLTARRLAFWMPSRSTT